MIHNPDAGDEHPAADEFLAWIRAAGHSVTYQSKKSEDWEHALVDPGDLVAVAGGDGTVRSVALRLVGRRIPIAVLPLGTANNISKTLGLNGIPVEQLVAGWAKARPLKFGVGVVTGPWGSTHFIEGIGVGLLTRAMALLDDATLAHVGTPEGRVKAALRWLQDRLWDYPASALKITLDGKDLSGEYILLEALNIQHIGPGLHLAPDADPRDGYLEFAGFLAEERDALCDYLAHRLEDNARPPRWTVRSGKRLRLEWDGSDLHIDDKVWPTEEWQTPDGSVVIEVRVERAALEFLV